MVADERSAHDLVELTRQGIDAFNHRDLDSAMRHYAHDAVWDASSWGFGTYEGLAEIRPFLEGWLATFEVYEQEVTECLGLGKGVVFAVTRFDSRPTRSTRRVQETWSYTGVWEAGGYTRIVARQDIDEARAAAERLARERG